MEQYQRIHLEPGITYLPSQKELKKMYLCLALSKYSYLRDPNYSERQLLKLLKSDFKKFTLETRTLMEQLPNNHSLHKFYIFFDNHYTNLKGIEEMR